MDMVTLTRLDCALGSSAIMRAGLAEAVHHARHRQAFGTALVDQPLMQRVLADMALDVAGATALAFRLARAFDEAANDREQAAFVRVMTPVVKYWVCKTAPALIYEAMECLGGNGYVEEAPLARYYREVPVNAIWEGSGNVMALDVLRVLARGPQLFEEVMQAIGRDLGTAGRGAIEVIKAAIGVAASDEGSARILTEQLALSAAAAELRRMGAGRIADAFVETRLAGQWARHLRHARRPPRCGRDCRHALSGCQLSGERQHDRHGDEGKCRLERGFGGIKFGVAAELAGQNVTVHGRRYGAAQSQIDDLVAAYAECPCQRDQQRRKNEQLQYQAAAT